MPTLPLSVCMVSGSEAHRIGRALESVAGWVAEIVVVMNHDVQDGTENVVAQHGGRVFREPWKGHIAQKNSAAEKTSQPWLFSLDADEVVSAPLRAAIEALFAEMGPGASHEPTLTPALSHPMGEGAPATAGAGEGKSGRFMAGELVNKEPGSSHAAFEFPRCTLYHGRWIRHGDWYPDRVRRLWRRGAGRFAGVEPHARLEVRGTIGRLRGDLLHYSMETFDHQIAKTIAYADDFVRHARSGHRRITQFDLLVRPTWRFLRAYVLRLGFLDGWQGYSVAWMTAFYTFLRYAKARAAEEAPEP